MFFLEWLVIVKEEELKESKSKLVKRTDWIGSGPGGRNGIAIKFPDYCLWKISCLRIVSRARLYMVVMDQRKWTQINVKKKKSFKQDVPVMSEPRSPRGLCFLVWKGCALGKSWHHSPHGKQWRQLFVKLKEAAALRILLHQRPASPPLPMGHLRPANEPCLKPSGEWAFLCVTGFSVPRLKLTATILWALEPRACRVCSSGVPILLCSYTFESKREAGDPGGSAVLPRRASCLHHLAESAP